ncbi:pyridoxamine 5'-phosphate oxidase family protein [Asticcacaulis endophyticus]|uniref:Pyridoxamine 5'-phosphate oxidase n=1 Tax=Asticcacaulis endophyticus TaxID=1395890 RepID=A0A918Q1G8_9CAUL|nr:pyridoxamine 5'-phosphate oxidase family protein [Asticcacaulis endophyticus]GGZ29059.1 pyridoxamine 5'-phosphate oxidase [Asticcacaulis endophyticus]
MSPNLAQDTSTKGAISFTKDAKFKEACVGYDYLDRLITPAVKAAQGANGAAALWERPHDRPSDRFTPAEAAFIAQRDSFYMASVSENGWPYVQHRGGPAGFLKVLDDTHLGFADFRGNRQYISLGNVSVDDRVSLFLMDYPHQARLKVLAHASVHDLKVEPELAAKLATPGYRGVAERGIVLRLEAFDWNCPQHITPRFTASEIEAATAPLRNRIAELEVEVAALRKAGG